MTEPSAGIRKTDLQLTYEDFRTKAELAMGQAMKTQPCTADGKRAVERLTGKDGWMIISVCDSTCSSDIKCDRWKLAKEVTVGKNQFTIVADKIEIIPEVGLESTYGLALYKGRYEKGKSPYVEVTESMTGGEILALSADEAAKRILKRAIEIAVGRKVRIEP